MRRGFKEFNPPPPPFSIYVYTRAALRRVLNELCGPRVGLSLPALLYTMLKPKCIGFSKTSMAQNVLVAKIWNIFFLGGGGGQKNIW